MTRKQELGRILISLSEDGAHKFYSLKSVSEEGDIELTLKEIEGKINEIREYFKEFEQIKEK